MNIEDAEMVLIRPCNRSSRDTVHLPDDEDPSMPKCNTELRSGRSYRERDPDRVPDHCSLCKLCDPDYERDTSNPGNVTPNFLEGLDPDEVTIK